MRTKILYILLVLLFAGYLALELVPRKPYDWSVGLGSRETNPFGTKLLRERLQDLFPGQTIREVRTSPKEALKEFEKSRTNYLIIAEELKMGVHDADALLRFVRRGNTLFLAADEISGALADSLGIDSHQDLLEGTLKSIGASPLKGQYLQFLDSNTIHGSRRFPLLDNIYYRHFNKWNGEILSFNRFREPVFLRIPFGDGTVLVHCVPMAFSNYYMVDPIFHRYISRALSYMPIQPVLWDEHFKPGNVRFDSSVGYLLQSTALKSAWILLLVTLVLFIVFDGKRKQRVVPIPEPTRNSTLEFVETISRLYLGHADHRDLAEKKIRFFLDHVRTRWMMTTQKLDEDFEVKLQKKSGVALAEIKSLFQSIREIRTKTNITQAELMALNEKIELFLEKSQT